MGEAAGSLLAILPEQVSSGSAPAASAVPSVLLSCGSAPSRLRPCGLFPAWPAGRSAAPLWPGWPLPTFLPAPKPRLALAHLHLCLPAQSGQEAQTAPME